jgi:hypothetical protein
LTDPTWSCAYQNVDLIWYQGGQIPGAFGESRIRPRRTASKSSQGRISYSPAPNGIEITAGANLVFARAERHRNHRSGRISYSPTRIRPRRARAEHIEMRRYHIVSADRDDNPWIVPHNDAHRNDNVGRGVAVAAIDEARFILARSL